MAALELVPYVPSGGEIPVGPLPSAKMNGVGRSCPHVSLSPELDFPSPGSAGMGASGACLSPGGFTDHSLSKGGDAAIGKRGKPVPLPFNLRIGNPGPQLLRVQLTHPENMMLSEEGEDI